MKSNTKKVVLGVVSLALIITVLLIVRSYLDKSNEQSSTKSINNTYTTTQKNNEQPTKKVEKKPYNYDLTDKDDLNDFVKSINSDIKEADYSTYVSSLHMLSENNLEDYSNGKVMTKVYDILTKYEVICKELFKNNKEIDSIDLVQDVKDSKGNLYGNQIYLIVSRDKFEKGCFSVLNGKKDGLDKFFGLGCIATNGKIKTLIEDCK